MSHEPPGVLLSDRLSFIQRAIADGAPLQEVFEAIADDCLSLIGPDEIVCLRTIHPDDPGFARIVAFRNVGPELMELLRKAPINEGVGGQAIRDNSLVVFEDYVHHPGALQEFAARKMRAAMAAPVRSEGRATGSLACGTLDPERDYSHQDQLALIALAEHASLAIAAAKATERIREADRDRQMFLAMVTHKLKTPLMIMSGAIDLLGRSADRLDEAKRHELLGQARVSIQNINLMIDGLLRGARAELIEKKETVELETLIRSSIGGFDASRPLRLVEFPQDSITINVEAFRQALGTLVENAIKHSPADSPIEVGARVATGWFTVQVTNLGQLPAQMDPDDLFLPLRQGLEGTGGIGLGLYIARRLALSMGGDVEAQADAGRVTFELLIPKR